jgi:hypothetical protein
MDGKPPHYIYFTNVELPPEVIKDLSSLINDPKGRCRLAKAGTLAPTWGDGSGTGTGGTVIYPDNAVLEMWMGDWTPSVFFFSSNWKKL